MVEIVELTEDLDAGHRLGLGCSRRVARATVRASPAYS
jgi:hypothetical protein